MRKKIPSPKTDQILALLREGPCTTSEVRAELGWPTNLIAAHLSQLCSKGIARSEQFSRDNKQRRLWSLIEQDV